MPPALTVTELREARPGADVLVVGPSLGTAVSPLWSACVALIPGDVRVIGWDLPGHGLSAAADEPFSVADLAEAVLAATGGIRRESDGRVSYAGVSLGGTVGLQLAVEHGDELDAVAVLCSGAKIGEVSGWHDRADLVRREGTSVMLAGSAERWFAEGFLDRDRATSEALLASLRATDSASYARCCEALADYDLRPRLGEVRIPVLAVAGAADVVTPAASAQEVADGTGGRAVVIDDAAHLAPAEQPERVARVLAAFLTLDDAAPDDTSADLNRHDPTRRDNTRSDHTRKETRS